MASSNVRKTTLDARYEIRLQSTLLPAIQRAAEREFTSPAEFIRRAIVEKLQADGISPKKNAA